MTIFQSKCLVCHHVCLAPFPLHYSKTLFFFLLKCHDLVVVLFGRATFSLMHLGNWIEMVKHWLSSLRMCFVFYLVERRSYRDGAKNKTKSTTCWRSSSMHPRTYSQICIRIFYLASRRLFQVSNALKRTEINAQGDLLCGVSFLVAGRWGVHLSQTFAIELVWTSFLVVCTVGTMGRHR